MYFLKFKTLICLLLLSLIAEAESVEITISNIRSSKGNIGIGLYIDNESFQKDKPLKKIIISKSKLINGVLKHTIDLPAGTYGFALLDDENQNSIMDSNFFGIPKEGYGFSGYNHSGMFRPTFSKFKFQVLKDAQTKVNINVDYF
jgi:uncharacterized protein (DUF2141 family)